MRGRVIAGFCYGQNTQTPQWAHSYRHVIARDSATSRRIIGELPHEASGVHIPDARNRIVQDFLDHAAKPDWLWMFDTDASFGPDVLDRLIASAHHKDRPIVGALAFGVRIMQDENGREMYAPTLEAPIELFPTIYYMEPNGNGTVIDWDYPKDTLMRVHSTGCHCVLINRSVLEDPRWKDDGHPLPWFRTQYTPNKVISEDSFFYFKAGSFGYPVHVDTSIKTGHVKTFVAGELMYDMGRPKPEPAAPAPVVESGGIKIAMLT